MRTRLVFTLAFLPVLLSAQERVTVQGRIVNNKGEAIEYVHVGIPKSGIGTVSSAEGVFEISVPSDTLEFHHVSYETGYYLVTGPAEDLVIVMEEAELHPAVFIGGETKEKYLLRAGTPVLGNGGVISFGLKTENYKGTEIGSVAHTRKPFLVQNIHFSIKSNYIPGCVVSVNIHKIEGKKESFTNILNKPIYADVAVSKDPQQFDIQPDEPVLLEPGKYFISFQIVGCDEQALKDYLATPETERNHWDMTLDCIIYFKSSYIRETALGELRHLPVNMGISVKGLEYL